MLEEIDSWMKHIWLRIIKALGSALGSALEHWTNLVAKPSGGRRGVRPLSFILQENFGDVGENAT
jgi:hypothetical protein